MTAPARTALASWHPGGAGHVASRLDDVRNAYVELIDLARDAPDVADPDWSGHAAEACRERLAEEHDAARRFAIALDDVADCLRTVGRRLDHAKRFVEDTAAQIEDDPHQLLVHEDWAVNISPMALLPVADLDPEDVRRAMVERQHQMDRAIRFLDGEDTACADILARVVERAAHAGRARDLAVAFERITGRPPETVTDWITASMLDPFTEAEKYQGTEAEVVVGLIRPEPGRGLVRTELFIPIHSVFNVSLSYPWVVYDLGDLRAPSATPTSGDSRVEFVVDYDNGLVVARQNPSVTVAGDVRVGSPRIDVHQLASGDVRVSYEAANPFAPPLGEFTHRVRGEVAVSSGEEGMTAGGVVGRYPSMEMYHHRPDGSVQPLLIEDAPNRSSMGPLLGLVGRRGVGELSVLESFDDPTTRAVAPEDWGADQVPRPEHAGPWPADRDVGATGAAGATGATGAAGAAMPTTTTRGR